MSDFIGTIAQILTLVSVFSMAIAVISLFGSIRDLRSKLLYLGPTIESTESSLSDISFGINLLGIDMEKMKRLRVSDFVKVNYGSISVSSRKSGISLISTENGKCFCTTDVGISMDSVISRTGTYRAHDEIFKNYEITKEEYRRLCEILGVD